MEFYKGGIMIIEFVNALFTLENKKEFELYSGQTENGGYTKVVIQANMGEGYSQQYYKIKQIIAEEGKKASIQMIDIPNLETVYKIIAMALKERGTLNGHSSQPISSTITEEHNTTSESNNNDSFIPVVQAQSRPVNKVLSTTREAIKPREAQSVELPRQTVTAKPVQQQQTYEMPAGIHDDVGFEDLDLFTGGGVKFANVPSNNNVPASAEHRSNIESLLGGEF